MTYRDYTPEQLGRKGEEIYETRIRPMVEEGNKGLYVVIDVETEEWKIGEDPYTLADALHQKRLEAPLYSLRVGYEATAFVGAAG